MENIIIDDDAGTRLICAHRLIGQHVERAIDPCDDFGVWRDVQTVNHFADRQR